MARKITAQALRAELRELGDRKIAAHSRRFFKAGPGDYGEGDRFLGIRVPVLRSHVRKNRDASLRTMISLLKSPWHEERLFAVLLLVQEYQHGSEDVKNAVFDVYLENRRFVNNWDIVDSSAHLIVGPHMQNGSRALLYKLAVSDSLWDRRISMMATYHFIRQHDFADAIKIADQLIDDEHDLIHKIVGWMLREIGKRDRSAEDRFLKKYYKKMPRTMLRYAIEKHPEESRQAYLNGTV